MNNLIEENNTQSTSEMQFNGRVALHKSTLKRLRHNLCLSQEHLVEKCREQGLFLSIASIKRAESGKRVLYNTAQVLACVLKVDIVEIIEPKEVC